MRTLAGGGCADYADGQSCTDAGCYYQEHWETMCSGTDASCSDYNDDPESCGTAGCTFEEHMHSWCEDVVYGCTDEGANNFNPDANMPDPEDPCDYSTGSTGGSGDDSTTPDDTTQPGALPRLASRPLVQPCACCGGYLARS